MRRHADVIIAGLGAMGSATAYHLARRGVRVLGFDRFRPPHALGSSHGKSRIIREAYFEDPAYVPLVQRAFEHWEELERRSGSRILVRTGGLMLGRPDGIIVAGALASARQFALAHEALSAAEVTRRFDGIRPDDDTVGVFEPRAGYVIPETAIMAHLELAARAGAELRYDEPIEAWEPAGDGVTVRTGRGAYTAGRLVLAAGAWITRLLGDLALPLVVERQIVYWFRPVAPVELPIFVWEYTPGHAWYGFPDHGDGVKVGLHHDGETTDPDSLRREVGADEVATIRGLLQRYIPNANGAFVDAVVCMYTNTPDSHFLIDDHPAYPQVTIVSPCSGHGFKFAGAIGEVLADRVLTGTTAFDLTPFGLRW